MFLSLMVQGVASNFAIVAEKLDAGPKKIAVVYEGGRSQVIGDRS